MKPTLLLLVLLSLAACRPESQIQADREAVFLKYYGNTTNTEGASQQQGADVQVVTDGGYMLLGNSNAFAETPLPEDHDLYLIKTDAAGNEIWSNTYGLVGQDERGRFLRPFSDGSCLLVGERAALETDSTKIVLLKVNSADGAVVWERVLRAGRAGAEHVNDVQILGGDSIMLTGRTTAVDVTKTNYNPDTDLEDVYTTVLDADGNTAWERIYGFPRRDEGRFIHQRGTEVVVIGTSNKGNSQIRNLLASLFMIKYQRGTGLVNSQNVFSVASADLWTLSAAYEAGEDHYRVLVAAWQGDGYRYSMARLYPDLTWDAAQDYQELDGPYDPNSNPALEQARLLQIRDGRYFLFHTFYVGGERGLDWRLAEINSDGSSFAWAERYGWEGNDFVGQLQPVYQNNGLEGSSLQGFLLTGTINFSTNPMVAFLRTNALGRLEVDGE